MVVAASLQLARTETAFAQPLISHADFPVLTPSSAMMKASLASNAQVWLCWGSNDGGTNFAAWQNNRPLGSMPAGALSQDLGSLNLFQKYQFAWRAVSSVGESWTSTGTFRPQQPGMIYQTSFESTELFPFSAGNLDMKGGVAAWRVSSGLGSIVGGGHSGTQAVQTAGGVSGLNLTNAAAVLWLDCFVMDPGSTNQPMLPASVANAVLFFSGTNGLLAMDGDGAGNGYFVQVQSLLPTNQFVRVTLRLDYVLKRYDVWVDGVQLKTGLGFKDNSVTSLLAFSRQSDATAKFDDFSVSTWGLDADSDGDGLKDLDEAKFYGSYALLADSDSDGMSDAAEVVAGTDPGDFASIYRIGIGLDTQRRPMVQIPTISGRQYTLQRRGSMSEPWQNVPGVSGVAGDGNILQFVETTVTNVFFYRAQVVKP